jgi:putative ABC transport system substrate-binding protein
MTLAPLLLSAVRALGTDVVIVRTSDDEPFKQAEAAVRKELEDQHYMVKSMLAREASDKGIEASIGKPDMVIAVGTAAAKWLHKQLPGSVKLTYCMVSHAGDALLTQGHHCAGITTDVPVGDQLKLVTEALPNVRSVGFMYRSDAPEGKAALADLQAAIPAGWHVEAVAVNDYPTVADAIDTLMHKPVDIIWTNLDARLWNNSTVRSLLTSAVRRKVPVWGFSPPLVRAGALLGVGIDPASQGRQAADLVVKTLETGGDLRTQVMAPTSVPIAINTTVADQIGVEIPDSITRRATFIYPEK